MNGIRTVVAFIGGAITTLIIGIAVEWYRQRNRLRLAVSEQRFEAHQQAYGLWLKLLSALRNEQDTILVLNACQDWWAEKCLYLDENARQAFDTLCKDALTYSSIPKTRENSELLEKLWKRINDAGKVFVMAVKLPSLGQ